MSIRNEWAITQRAIYLAARERGCTQEAIAEHLRVPRGTVARWFHTSDPLEMTVGQLMGLVEFAGDIATLDPLVRACSRDLPPRRTASDVVVDLFASAGELVAEHRAAKADGHVDERERAKIAAVASRTGALAAELADLS